MRRAAGLVVCVVMTLALGCGDDKKYAASGPKSARQGVKGKLVIEEPGAGAPALGAPGMGMPGMPVMADLPADQVKKQAEKSRRQMIVYTGRVDLVVEDFDEARGRILELLKEHNGYEASSEQSGQPGESRRGKWTLRVPAAGFQPFLDAVTGVGELRSRTTESDDITDRYYDVQAEATNLEAREKALRKLYEEKIAGSKLAELMEVDRELSKVRGDINVLKGQMQRWEQQTAFATLTVELQSRQGYVPPASPAFDTMIGRTFLGSVDAMLTLGKGVVLFAVAVVPWLVVLGALAAPVWIVARRRRRKATA